MVSLISSACRCSGLNRDPTVQLLFGTLLPRLRIAGHSTWGSCHHTQSNTTSANGEATTVTDRGPALSTANPPASQHYQITTHLAIQMSLYLHLLFLVFQAGIRVFSPIPLQHPQFPLHGHPIPLRIPQLHPLFPHSPPRIPQSHLLGHLSPLHRHRLRQGPPLPSQTKVPPLSHHHLSPPRHPLQIHHPQVSLIPPAALLHLHKTSLMTTHGKIPEFMGTEIGHAVCAP